MATEAENLRTAYDQIIEKILEVTANPKPDYSVDGQSVSWSAYYSMLMRLRQDLREALLQAEGPFEFHIRGTT